MTIYPCLLGILLAVSCLFSPSLSQTCTRTGACSCNMNDGSGAINLRSLAATDGTAKWTLNGGDGWMYSYNPCVGYDSLQFTNLAVLQKSATGSDEYNLGTQDYEDFITNLDSSISIYYYSHDFVRLSYVLLVCSATATDHSLLFLGELITAQYEFILTSPCACPGGCDNNGIITQTAAPPTVAPTCIQTGPCSCSMLDGSGEINLRSLASLNGPRWALSGGNGWTYSYNPCVGWTSTQFTNLAVLQESQFNPSEQYNLGTQDNEEFVTNADNSIAISYLSHDGLRLSYVLLVCQASNNDHDLIFIGETVVTQYEFILTSPCACPGSCDDNGIISQPTVPPTVAPTCIQTGPCSCSMLDGSGEINLRSLASLNGPRWALSGWDGWTYSYNPCVGWASTQFTNLAVLQESQFNPSEQYNLGTQDNEEFVTNADNSIAISYLSHDGLRLSYVLLVCQASNNDHDLIFIGETAVTQYEFILTSPCACPGSCNDNGIISQTAVPPTVAPTCIQTGPCSCSMLDGSGEINLRSLASLNGPRWALSGWDGWTYSYNPCVGWASTQFTNLAVLQESQFNPSEQYNLGTQDNEEFVTNADNSIAISYLSHDGLRLSYVLLVCQASNNDHDLIFIGETAVTEYEFILTSPCACPGSCNDNGIISQTGAPPTIAPTCTQTGPCSCLMKDGTGEINLKSLASTNGPRWTLDGGDGWKYSYNPCVGYSSTLFSNLAVLQESQFNPSEQYNLGTQDNEEFVTNTDTTIAISYFSHDYVRLSYVLLICDLASNNHNLLFIGELVTTQYEFILSSPCACPGACNDFGIISPVTTTTPNGVITTPTPPDGVVPPCNGGDSDSSDLYWSQVGADLVGLIFHDLILVVVIAMILLLLKYVFSYSFACCYPQSPSILFKAQSEA